MIEVDSLVKEYNDHDVIVKAIDNISLTIPEKGLIGILGVSGGGKTTLLNCLSGLDTPTGGTVKGISKSDVAFIFQDYQLLENLSVRDNLSLFSSADENEINETLKKVGLEQAINKKVNQLSGGQKQRIAIARAVLLDAKYIFADEPTGNLDSKTSKEIISILKELSKQKLVLIVSHDKELITSFADRILTIEDGKIISDTEINKTEDAKEESKKEKNGNKDISMKNMMKIRKSANSKISSSKIFNIFFTFLLMLTVFLGLNVITTSNADAITTASKDADFAVTDFKIKEKNTPDTAWIDEEKLQKLKNKIPSLMVCYPSG